MHWIITNRKVETGGDGIERVVPDVHEPSPIFRVARYAPASGAPGLEGSDLERFVTFAKDADHPGYAVTSDADPASVRGTAQMFLDLYQRMSAGRKNKAHALFFIHGFNYSWPEALENLQKLHEIYVEPEASPIGHIVFFTWPSYGSLTRYPSDQAAAVPSGLTLGRLFGKALKFYEDFFSQSAGTPPFCGQKLHLAAHSMGNQVLREFFRGIAPYRHLHRAIFAETVLLNADVEWQALEPGEPLHELPEYCDRVHVYNNFQDDALRVSETTKNGDKRLGLHGPRDWHTPPMSVRTVIVDTTGLPNKARANTGDATDRAARNAVRVDTGSERWAAALLERDDPTIKVSAREALFDHWGYLHRPQVIADLYRVFRGESSGTMKGRVHREGPLFRLTGP